jgi:hypothetical protein
VNVRVIPDVGHCADAILSHVWVRAASTASSEVPVGPPKEAEGQFVNVRVVTQINYGARTIAPDVADRIDTFDLRIRERGQIRFGPPAFP